MYESALQTVHDNINNYYNRFLLKEERLMRKNYRDLCEIAEAIRKRQANKARLVAKNHVHQFYQFMEREQRRRRGNSISD
jgi:DNA-binding GntR family transcriptional regulator